MHTPSDPGTAEITTSASQVGFPAAAVRMDTSESDRLPVLMEMVAALSRAEDANDVLRAFSKGLARIHGPQGYVSISTRGLAPGEYKITRLLDDNVPANITKADPWKDWASLPTHSGGYLGTIIRSAYPQVVHNLYLRDDPVVGDALAKYGSMLAIPLFDNGEPLNWSITFREDAAGFSLRDLEETLLRSNLGGVAVKNTIITRQLQEAHATLRREVEQIAAIQKALLPASIPDIPGLDIDVSYTVFDQAGGDMYALQPLRLLDPEAVGDGPGVPPRTLPAWCRGMRSACPRSGASQPAREPRPRVRPSTERHRRRPVERARRPHPALDSLRRAS